MYRFLLIGLVIAFFACSSPSEKPVVEQEPIAEIIQNQEFITTQNKAFYFVTHNKYVILEQADTLWGSGPKKNGEHGIVQAVDDAKLPSKFQKLNGNTLFVYDATGKEQKVVIKQVALMALSYTPFPLYEQGEETVENQIQGYWKDASYTYLIAEIDSTTFEPVYASAVSQQNQFAVLQASENKEMIEKLLTSLEQYSIYDSLQTEYVRMGQEMGEQEGRPQTWIDYERSYTFYTTAFQGKNYVMAQISAGYGCGDFYGSLTVLWEMKEDGQYEMKAMNTTNQYELHSFSPMLITDFDKNGNVESWGYKLLIENNNDNGWSEKESVNIATFECGC